jgi:phenol hydroxylase P4 protein
MPVTPLKPGYAFPSLDREEKFHGNRLVYFHWEGHLNFCAALCFPLPPSIPFGAAVEQVLAPVYGDDPAWENIDWAAARWTLDDAPFTPDFKKSLDALGVRHKSLLRFWTKK